MKNQATRRPTRPSLLSPFRLLAITCLLGSAYSGFSQLELLKDVDTNEERIFNEYSSFVSAGNHMYFVSNNELWKSNGTTKYTVKMKAFSSISNLTMVGATLFFTADDGQAGLELWKSNGTPASTVRVKDIEPGEGSSSPSNLTSVDGILYFAANTADKGTELWKSNGTGAGTTMVKDISRGSANPRNLVDFNGVLYFAATSPSGYELWKSGGTPESTVLIKDINPGAGSSNPSLLTVSNDQLFFVAMQPGAGLELWVSGGTTASTQLLKDIRPGTGTSAPENLIHANGKLMFTANDGIHGDELWSSNGTAIGTVLVKDMNPGPAGSNTTDPFLQPMGHFTNINGILYFIASKGSRDYIYRSDGTTSGTVSVTEAFGIMINEPQPEFTYRNGYVYFFNAHPGNDYIYSLYKMPYKGQEITRIKNFEVESQDYYMQLENQMIFLNGAVFFPARFSTEYGVYGGYELIRSDGTAEGTKAIHDTYVPTESSYPREMITMNGRVYSLHYSNISYTPQLYSTDGTPEGTFELRPERYHYDWEVVGDDLYFSEEIHHTDGAFRWQLSKTKGTPASTHVVTYGPAGDENIVPKGLTNVNGALYYFNGHGEVYRSDGTMAGTQRIADLYEVTSITNVNGQAFILSPNNIDELVLWKTNAQGGLTQVGSWDRAVAADHYIQGATMEVGGIFYFLMSIGGDSHQIWRSNGTAAGTYKMFGPEGFQDNPLQPSYSHVVLLEYKNQLYFNDGTALYKVTGETYSKVKDLAWITNYAEFKEKMILFTGDSEQYVFVSDGSSEGTSLLTYRSQVEYYFFTDYAISGDYLYFNSLYSAELYRTDGTACETAIVDAGAESPFALEALGGDLIFGGYKQETGTELYVYHNVNSIPGNDCEASQLAARPLRNDKAISKIMSSYPNPFTDSFTLKVDGHEGDIAEVAVFTGGGLPVELLKGVAVNREHVNVGSHWPRGLYIIKVQTREKAEVFQVLKE